MSKGKIFLGAIVVSALLAGHGLYKGEDDCAKGTSLVSAYMTMIEMVPIQSHAYKFRVRQCLGYR